MPIGTESSEGFKLLTVENLSAREFFSDWSAAAVEVQNSSSLTAPSLSARILSTSVSNSCVDLTKAIQYPKGDHSTLQMLIMVSI